MIAPWRLFGRLGNQMFQMAFLYAYSRDANVDYYFQDEEYFSQYKDEICQLFGQDIKPIDMVAIHVRRGDYVSNPFYVDLTSTQYYWDAIKQFPVDTQFLVFSDDIEWCKTYFVGKEFTFSEDRSEIDDLNLMAGCKGIIIANSSFSWWAAYLGDQSKKVIAPKAWYTDCEERTKLPKTWIRI